MAEEPRKRSRFDQAPDDAEPARKSRFDRRSRSPASTKDDVRSRSPVNNPSSNDSPKKDAATIAAEAAARINASLQSKRGIQHVDVPPILSSSSGGPGALSPSGTEGTTLNAEVYQQDGDFIKDIEIKEETGADVTTRGSYYPDKSMATAANPPLYLHVTSTTKDGLDQAVNKIEELMKQQLPNLIDERRFRRRGPEEQPEREREREPLVRRKWPEESIPIDLEPIPGFNLRAQVVGYGGQYVKHIQQETRCRVQIKGRGSGYLNNDTGQESDEQMYLHVHGPEQAMVDLAKEQCLSLLDSVRQNYENFKARGPPQSRAPGGGNDYGDQRGGFQVRGDRQSSGTYGGGSAYDGGHSYSGGGGGDSSYSTYGGGSSYGGYGSAGHGAQGYGGGQSPAATQTPGTTDPAEQQKQYEAWSAYYTANPSADPYISYGGYAAVMAQYMVGGGAYAQGYQTAGASMSPSAGNGAAPPPPPPDDQVPPPPPPGAGNGYNAVPPPPGM